MASGWLAPGSGAQLLQRLTVFCGFPSTTGVKWIVASFLWHLSQRIEIRRRTTKFRRAGPRRKDKQNGQTQRRLQNLIRLHHIFHHGFYSAAKVDLLGDLNRTASL